MLADWSAGVLAAGDTATVNVGLLATVGGTHGRIGIVLLVRCCGGSHWPGARCRPSQKERHEARNPPMFSLELPRIRKRQFRHKADVTGRRSP